LQRLERYEAQVRAWVYLDREGARAEAERLGSELQKGQDRGPLHGIPLGIKDIIDVFDWPTAAGSSRWAHSLARHDAEVVRRLREAGAVLLGKTVTTQYASFDPPPTRNPWDLSRTPGGSSSGSAAAVACGMCLGALGSQTGGSLTRPASYCGVASYKPSYRRVSTTGVLPLAPSMDHVGPMAGCVRDLALLLETISRPGLSTQPAEDLGARVANSCPPPRLGRLRGLFDRLAEPCVQAMMERVEGEWRAKGATVQEVTLPSAFAEMLERHRTVMAVEAAAYHEQRLRRHPEDYEPNIRALLEEGLACPAPEYARCKDHQTSLKEEMLACFGNVDVLLTPATTGPAPDAATTGNPAFNSPWSYTGLPTLSLPAERSPEGLPLAVQLVGNFGDEAALFRAAAWCERVIGWEWTEPPAEKRRPD
jgi:aspartyl-tRNA(Asn)/glutamyl-tRNA(Gln) amidotransferase subunit A